MMRTPKHASNKSQAIFCLLYDVSSLNIATGTVTLLYLFDDLQPGFWVDDQAGVFRKVIAHGLPAGKAGVTGTGGRLFQNGIELRVTPAAGGSETVHGNAKGLAVVSQFEDFGKITVLADSDFTAIDSGEGVGVAVLPLLTDDFDQFAAGDLRGDDGIFVGDEIEQILFGERFAGL